MLEDSGMDVNHYSDYGVSVVGNWMAEEIERRVGKGRVLNIEVSGSTRR